MKREVTSKNYRQYYKDYFGIDFGSNLHIHHIDGNRENNHIDNLLLMPKELHSKFHLASYSYEDGYKLFSPKLEYILPNGLSYSQEMFKIYIDCIIEIQKWVYYKEFKYQNIKLDDLKLKK